MTLPFMLLEMLDICGMTEPPTTGNSFTWSGRRGNLWVQSKLDRAFGSKEWFSCFPVANQAFLAKRGSDHHPVLVKLISSQESFRGSFRFDKRMLHKPFIREAINKAWNTNSQSLNLFVATRLRFCRKALSRWKKDNQFNSKDRISKLRINQPNSTHSIFL